MGRAIFISYRRDDSEGEAGRLFDDLVRSFGEGSVFMDVSGINPGMDFRKAIDDNVASCGVLLAIIGPHWCSIAGSGGGRRLDDPNDFVRLEIASALARDIAVIPVLVHDAKMPRPDDLPENLKNLAFRNSVEITHTRWNSDVLLLTEALKRYVAPTAITDTKPVHATVAVQLPPPTTPATRPDSGRKSNLPLILGVVAAAVVALGAVAFLVFPGNPLSAFTGKWTNPAPEAQNGINRLDISASGDQLSVHAWGKCAPSDCDWGSQPATVDGQQARATWRFGQMSAGNVPARTATVVLKPMSGQLSVSVSNTYANSGPAQRQFTFVKAQ
jgi:hypothetical protein